MKRKTGSQAFNHEVRDQKSTEQTFMDKGAVSQGTKDEKNKKKKTKKEGKSNGKRTFKPAAKDSSYLGKMTRVEGSQKS